MNRLNSLKSSRYRTALMAGHRGSTLLIVLLVVIFFLCATMILILKLPPLTSTQIAVRQSVYSPKHPSSTLKSIEEQQLNQASGDQNENAN